MQKYDLGDFDTSNISDKNGRLFMEKIRRIKAKANQNNK